MELINTFQSSSPATQGMNPFPQIASTEVTVTKKTKSEFLQFQNFNELGAQPDYSLSLIGEKGYRTARANHGLTGGCFYFEVEMQTPLIPLPFLNVNPALRIGFATDEDEDLELPLGSKMRSYCYSSTGKLITNSKAAKVMNESFNQKDVIGALIFLQPPKPGFLRGSEVHEISTGSYIQFYKNGEKSPQGFSVIYEGTYFAAVSLYMQAQCKINFGDTLFKHPPPIVKSAPEREQWKPYKEVIRIKSPVVQKSQ